MTETIVLGGGCFWCTEAAYQIVKGVVVVVPGYAGGNDPQPTYEKVCEGTTGHAEVVRVSFDTSVISLSDILSIFWIIHDPTTPNRQGADIGSQYRSVIFYTTDEQVETIRRSVDEVKHVWGDTIKTEIAPLIMFYEAESYHHNYFLNHPEQGYCQAVINPKLAKLREKYA